MKIEELDLAGRMKQGWAEKRAPFEKLIGKRVTGTGPTSRVVEGVLIKVSTMALTAEIRKDDESTEHVWCRTLQEVS